MLKRILTTATVLLITFVVLLVGLQMVDKPTGLVDVLALVISDDVPFDDVQVRAWMDAALEEGLHLEPMHAQDLLRPTWRKKNRFAGIILPDGIHRNMSGVLIDTLTEFVQEGGQLMVVFDAGTLNLSGGAVPNQSRLTSLVGIQYALYKELGDNTLVIGAAFSTPEILTELNLPPGKYTPTPGEFNQAELRESRQAAGLATSREVVVSSYNYPWLEYGHFVTHGRLLGKTLMVSEAGDLLAGIHDLGKGRVLFVNLPLTYHKLRTDGAPLHGFLHYFAVTLLNLPSMGNTPAGIGGLIMNWHVDSSLALKSLQQMADLGFYHQGPYSVHFTAGPDTNTFGDKMGLDVEHRADTQKWIRRFVNRGDEVGSHGGWIHNYFGENVTEENGTEFARYLDLNNREIEKVIGRPVLEYSAPMGNHPVWTTRWLETHGVRSYYFTGNIGQGPTRSYLNGERLDKNTWSFPVCSYGVIATFEEAARAPVISQLEMGRWLVDLTDFVSGKSLIRLVYFHPPGVVTYPTSARMWLDRTKALQANGTFRWYTMSGIARFLDRREQVRWQIGTADENNMVFTAAHDQDLIDQTWRFPKHRYGKPMIIEGSAAQRETPIDWVIIARSGKQIKARIPTVRQGTSS